MESQQNQERKPLSYYDFILQFASYQETDGTFKVWVEEAPSGTMKPDDATKCSYNPIDYEGLLDDLDRREADPQDMFKLGEMLANLALPEGDVRNIFWRSLDSIKAGEGLRLRLKIDPPALKHLPWELMLLSRVSGEPQELDFLALQPNISIVRTDTSNSKGQDLTSREQVKIAGMLSCPSDQKQLKLEQEQTNIEKAIQQIKEVSEQSLIEIAWAERPATRESLEKALSQEVDVFHYAGHASFGSSGSLILETIKNGKTVSDEYDGQKLAVQLQSKGRAIRLVVLGACKTGRRNDQSTWSGIASTLSREKIPAVIANQFTISDDNAIQLAFAIYSFALLAGFTIDEAISNARRSIYNQSGLQQRDWATTVLYLQDKTGVLFPLAEANTLGKRSTSLRGKLVTHYDEVTGGKAVGTKIGKAKSGELDTKTTFGKVKDAEVYGTIIDEFG